MKKNLSREFKDSYLLSFVWIKLSTLDILKRYRRSFLGPFWITITTLITTFTLSFIYSKVLNLEIYEYFPYLTIGLICQNFVSTLLNDCETFIESERIIKQENFSFIVYVLRVISRNYIILFHNLLIFLIIFFILGIPSIKNLLLFILSLIVIFTPRFQFLFDQHINQIQRCTTHSLRFYRLSFFTNTF